ncbi:MAG: ester cyclase [Ignavibacterium sp.]|nr:ester cyclase [Ignavibacterium sp.]
MSKLINTSLKTGSLFLLIAVLFATGCQQPKPDPSVEMKPIVDKLENAWNGRNIDALDAIFAPDFVRIVNNQPEANGVEGYKKAIADFRTAYPDLKLTLDNTLYAENGGVTRWVLTGTNTGPGQMPPTGKSVNIWGLSIVHIANGKVTKEIVAFDNQDLMEQLGFTMVPPAAGKK